VVQDGNGSKSALKVNTEDLGDKVFVHKFHPLSYDCPLHLMSIELEVNFPHKPTFHEAFLLVNTFGLFRGW
jgi:hypothetical protein